MSDKWTREEFEANYNNGAGVPERLRSHGRLSIQCYEDYEHECHGWKLSNLDMLEFDVEGLGNTQEEVDAAIAYRLKMLDKQGSR